MNAIEIKNLRKDFRVKEKAEGFSGSLQALFKPKFKTVHAVNGLSLEIPEGQIVAFIGPNGAGKSTTIKMLAGILYPTSGKISVLGLNPTLNREKLAMQIGSVFGQRSQLWYHLPAIDSFNLLAKIYELDNDSYIARRDELIRLFEIEPYLKTPVRKLSLGERMRCEITASLLHRPRIVFLDEPTIGLDVIAKQSIREIIRKVNKEEGVTIFLTSHDAGDVESLADRTVVINYGSIVYDDTTENFKKDYIKSKTIELTFNKPLKNFEYPFGKVLETGKYNLKIEFNTGKESVNDFMRFAFEKYDINDINIFDPSMEEIIGAIYREKKHEKSSDA
jgi:ABC-2 type transport system ATP-binding protein